MRDQQEACSATRGRRTSRRGVNELERSDTRSDESMLMGHTHRLSVHIGHARGTGAGHKATGAGPQSQPQSNPAMLCLLPVTM